MSDLFQTSPEIGMNAERQPIVVIKDGGVYADSRDVAAFFGKRHDDVLRAIRALITQKMDLGLRNFTETPYVAPQNGQTYKSFAMDRKGFTLLAMGFTGAKALEWQIKYIDAFDTMEAALRERPTVDPMVALNDPSWLRNALGVYTEKVIALEASNAAMQAGVEALERIAESNGKFNRTTAAKMLGVTPHTLIRWMRTNGWTYRRPGTADDIAYQSKIAAGYLEHKIATGPRPDGTEWSSTSVLVTPRELTVLAKAFPPIARSA